MSVIEAKMKRFGIDGSGSTKAAHFGYGENLILQNDFVNNSSTMSTLMQTINLTTSTVSELENDADELSRYVKSFELANLSLPLTL